MKNIIQKTFEAMLRAMRGTPNYTVTKVREKPHQGKQEVARRQKQIADGKLNPVYRP